MLLPLFVCLFSSATNAQLSITGYSTFAIGAETKLYKKVNGEFRIFTNNILDESNMEVQFYYGFNPKRYHQIRLGAGINGNIFYGEVNTLQIPLQLQIFPIQDNKKLALLIEFAPQWLIYDPLNPETLILRHLWGIKYTFGGE